MSNKYLMHHGTKGQKWGIRRYQNPDGSLTDAGKKRYSNTYIQKGSTIRRIAGVYSKDDNPVGLYAYTPKDAETYRKTGYWLPSVGAYTGNRKKLPARETQYEFTKDASILSGEKAISDYMKRYGDMTAGQYRKDFQPEMGNQKAYAVVGEFAKKYKDVPVSKIYNDTKNTDKGKVFTHDFIHNTGTVPVKWLNEHEPKNTKSALEDLADHYRSKGVDVIIDPEDYSGGFDEPLIVLNKDTIKRGKSKIINVGRDDYLKLNDVSVN